VLSETVGGADPDVGGASKEKRTLAQGRAGGGRWKRGGEKEREKREKRTLHGCRVHAGHLRSGGKKRAGPIGRSCARRWLRATEKGRNGDSGIVIEWSLMQSKTVKGGRGGKEPVRPRDRMCRGKKGGELLVLSVL